MYIITVAFPTENGNISSNPNGFKFDYWTCLIQKIFCILEIKVKNSGRDT
jgi:hypothetical protein